jgi:hypothetical protein
MARSPGLTLPRGGPADSPAAFVDPEFEQIIPDDLIGRTLSGDEAAELQRRLRGDAQYSRGRGFDR